jgi:hypothetical protein
MPKTSGFLGSFGADGRTTARTANTPPTIVETVTETLVKIERLNLYILSFDLLII